MAMTMTGEYQLPVPPQAVWEKLNDPATLKICIPGCEQLDKTSDTEFQAVATIKVAPSRRAGRAKCVFPISTRPAAIASQAKAKGVLPALPEGAPKCRSPKR